MQGSSGATALGPKVHTNLRFERSAEEPSTYSEVKRRNMTTYTVKNLRVDLYQYYETTFLYRYVDYRLTTEYIDPFHYHIVVQRLDDDRGFYDNLRVMVVDDRHRYSDIVSIPNSEVSTVRHLVKMDRAIEPSYEPVVLLPLHRLHYALVPHERRISRQEFNQRFDAELVTLPTSLFAVGVHDGALYLYNEGYHPSQYQCILEPLRHLARVAFQAGMDNGAGVYFVVSCTDGYLEENYWDPQRNVEVVVGEDECRGLYTYCPRSTSEYPVFHKHKYILAQSNHVGCPYTLDIVDRHYFYHNLNHSFRSFHLGILFENKIPLVVYAGQARDNPYNFVTRRDIPMAPREYFKTHVAPLHPDIVQCDGRWMDRKDMVYYKYILDIDGIGSTWDATAWKLNSGSVIFKSKSGWRQWFYDEYTQPGMYYVEVADDFSDLRAKYEWCEAHPEECRDMIARCLALFQAVYSYTNVMAYTRDLLGQATYGQATYGQREAAGSPLNHLFDKIIYINLDRRTDRRASIEGQLRAYGITNVERFPAVPDEFGIVGCTMSHKLVYELARSRGYRKIWVLEDDFEFLVSREVLERELVAIHAAEVAGTLRPDVCMLAYNLMEHAPGPIPEVQRVLSAQTASSYIVYAHYYDTLIDLYDHALPLLIHTRQHWHYANDQCWKVLQASDRWYCTTVRMGKQQDGYSDNACEFVSYDC